MDEEEDTTPTPVATTPIAPTASSPTATTPTTTTATTATTATVNAATTVATTATAASTTISLLVSGSSASGTIQLWNAFNGEKLGSPIPGTDPIWAVAISPHGKYIAWAGDEKVVRIFDTVQGAVHHSLAGHTECIYSLSWLADGSRLASAGADGTIRVWNVESGECVHVWQKKPEGEDAAAANENDSTVTVWSVCFSPKEDEDHGKLAAGLADGSVLLWQPNAAFSDEQAQLFPAHESMVRQVAYSPSGNTIATGGLDAKIFLWNAANAQKLKILQGHTAMIWCIRFAKEDSQLASSSADKTVRVWDITTGQCEHTFSDTDDSEVYSVAFSEDGNRIYASSRHGVIQILDVVRGGCIRTLTAHRACFIDVGQTALPYSGVAIPKKKHKPKGTGANATPHGKKKPRRPPRLKADGKSASTDSLLPLGLSRDYLPTAEDTALLESPISPADAGDMIEMATIDRTISQSPSESFKEDPSSFEVVTSSSMRSALQPQILEHYLRNGIGEEEGEGTTDVIDLEAALKHKRKKYTIYSKLGTLDVEEFSQFDETLVKRAVLNEECWIDVENYTKGDVKMLAKIFGIHPLIAEDIMAGEEREKCEYYDKVVFVALQAIENNTDNLQDLTPHCVYMILFQYRVITFHNSHTSFDRVLRRLDAIKQEIELDSSWMLYAVCDAVIDAYAPVMNLVKNECDALDSLTDVLTFDEHEDAFRRIGVARKIITKLERLFTPKGEVFRLLLGRLEFLHPRSDSLSYFQDVNSHILTMHQNIGGYSEFVDRIHGNFIATISIESTQFNNDLSITMRKMSAYSAVLLPLTLISGIWGMNVRVPGQLQSAQDEVYWFFVILLAMAIIAIVIVYYGRKWKWF